MGLFKIFILIFSFIPSLSFAANLRGRIDAMHAYASAPFPARGVQVQLLMQSPRGPIPVNHYFTGSDGMYYFQEIIPGEYILNVGGYLNFPIRVYDVYLQDIRPVLIRY